MAKKFVRGVTGVDDIEKFDKSLTNVNDLISDGKATYVHTKQGKNEKYVNITDKITSITSGDTGLIDVSMTGDNNANLTPKHDTQKEQLLESTRNTVTIEHGSNGTSEKTKVDTNPAKVLEHENLLTDYGISKTTTGNTTKLGIEYTKVPDGFDLNSLTIGSVRGNNLVNSPTPNSWFFIHALRQADDTIQYAVNLVDVYNVSYVRRRDAGVWGPWREQVGDKSVIDGLLAQKQNTITNNTSIGVSGTGLRQLYTNKQSYSHANGILKTHVKSVSANTSVTTPEEEFNFTVKINQNAENIVVTLNEHDTTAFNKIMAVYGSNNTINISGCVFTLSGSSLTVTTTNNTAQNYVMSFSDILD